VGIIRTACILIRDIPVTELQDTNQGSKNIPVTELQDTNQGSNQVGREAGMIGRTATDNGITGCSGNEITEYSGLYLLKLEYQAIRWSAKIC
jgi:hypothetical protein